MADLLGRTVWTAEAVRAKLLSDQVWVERGLMAIYRRQTSLEKQAEEAIFVNGRGFGAFDAKMGSYLAAYCKSGKHLSGPFVVKGRKIVLKYVGQLVEIANSSEGGSNVDA